MKTDLTKVLAVSGQSGLFIYLAQARNGAVLESLVTKQRSSFGLNAKMTALEDISIYTEDEEVKLKEVFLKMKEVLGDADAPSSKASSNELKAFFEKALPSYDKERFYVSHMKKVVDWYNCLKNYASLDFADPEENAEQN